MGTEENVNIVRRFYEEAFNQQQPDACERLLTNDFVHNNEFRGRDGQQAAVNTFLTGFPDLKVQTLMTVAEDDRVAAHLKWTGTHQGEFLDIPGTGNPVEFTSTAILLIHQGLIAQAWDEVDLFGIEAQLRT